MTRQERSMRFILMVAIIFLMVGTVSVRADTVQPTIVSVSPENNDQDIALREKITVTFSEEMDPSTINENTFTVEQRTTPQTGEIAIRTVEGTIAYSGRTATFTPAEKLNPNQHYGNVFTVTVTPGAKDLAGNAIARDYVWSFTTGQDPYSTGASTSQTDQRGAVAPTPVPPTPVTPTPVTPVTEVSAQESVPWIWILGGALLLLLVAWIGWFYFSSRKSERTPEVKSTRVVNSHPFGDVHQVMDLEGIGPVYGKKLQAMGISDTKQLWEASAAKVSDTIGAPVRTVVSWQHMAELASIHGIGPQYAELLERSGVHTIDQLKNYKKNELLKLVRKKQDSLNIHIQGNTPGTALVGNWIEQAQEHSMQKGQSA